MSKQPYIECAKIVNTHGCHGGVKLESWCNTPEELESLSRIYLKNGASYVEYKIQKASVFKQFVLMDLEGIHTMDDALRLKNRICYALREDFSLEEGEYFIADLMGLPVLDATSGKEYGKVKDFINRGASDLYVVETPAGEVMVPAVPAFVDHVDLSAGVFITPIEGMFSSEEI